MSHPTGSQQQFPGFSRILTAMSVIQPLDNPHCALQQPNSSLHAYMYMSPPSCFTEEQKREKRHKKSASFHGNLPSCFTEEPLGQKKGKGHKKLASF